MIPTLTLNVADWTTTPGHRYSRDCEWSGEEYRDKILIPALEKAQVVEVNLDGVLGCSSGWLSEVFQGVISKLGPDVVRRIRVTSTQYGQYVNDVRGWMDEALQG